ncbi:hypothetical protein Cadr_000006142 [Camelus dromedarius]|uniref:Uncharacterized protein n=1 Tax=Camelus dromedarius TaxID=9838 RepID=A0A5N4E3Q6_CAMDR|nr:hypothetical protein Cadr_000006142 [Camelus dromedarius]
MGPLLPSDQLWLRVLDQVGSHVLGNRGRTSGALEQGTSSELVRMSWALPSSHVVHTAFNGVLCPD